MAQPHYVAETQILRRVIRNHECRWIWTKHALEQMAKRRISAADIQHTLTNGRVILSETKQDEVWRIEGRDIDGNRLQVEAVVYEHEVKVKVVTAF